MEGEIVIKRWADLDGEVSSYRLCCLLRLTPTYDSPKGWAKVIDGVKVISGSVCKVRTQDTDNFDEEVKPLASARWIDFGDL